MVLSIKTTLKDLLNSRFIIIYRFQPNSHSKMAGPTGKYTYKSATKVLETLLRKKQPSRILVSNINNLLRIKPFNLRQLFCNIFYIAAVVSFTSVRLRCHIWTVCLKNNSIHRYILGCLHKLPGILKCKNASDSYIKAHVKKISCCFPAV